MLGSEFSILHPWSLLSRLQSQSLCPSKFSGSFPSFPGLGESRGTPAVAQPLPQPAHAGRAPGSSGPDIRTLWCPLRGVDCQLQCEPSQDRPEHLLEEAGAPFLMHSTSQTSASARSMLFETVCVQQKKTRSVPGLPLLGTYLRKVNTLIWEDARTIIYSCQDIAAA